MSNLKTKSDLDRAAQRRFRLFIWAFLALGLVVFVRLINLHIFPSSYLVIESEKHGKSKKIIAANRGGIFELNGIRMTNILTDYVELSISPYTVIDPQRLASDLSEVLGKSSSFYLDRLTRSNSEVLLAQQVSPQQMQRLSEKRWNFIHSPNAKRIYPHNRLASQVLGFVDTDNRGVSGIELSYDNILSGQHGWMMLSKDRRGNEYINNKLPSKNPIDGNDLRLTIDLSIQSILEEELSRAMSNTSAKMAGGIIMDPYTFEIRAMAALPSFDPNHPSNASDKYIKNRMITDQMELGSVLKIIPASLLLEKELVKENETVDCSSGKFVLGKDVIRDVGNNKIATFREAFYKSINSGIIKFSQRLKPEDIYQQIVNFGLLEKTDIELSGEAPGYVLPWSEWRGITRHNIVIGHGISVNALQLACVYAAIVNDGVMMKPTIVKGIQNPDGSVDPMRKGSTRRIIPEKTARELVSYMIDVVEKGSGKAARMMGIVAGGKTGTAQKPNLTSGGYHKDKHIASFVGFAKAKINTNSYSDNVKDESTTTASEQPTYIIMIVLDEPQGLQQGGAIAAPVFKRVAERVIKLRPYQTPVDPSLLAEKSSSDKSDSDASDEKESSRGFPGFSLFKKQDPPKEPTQEEILLSKGIVVIPKLNGMLMRDAIQKATNLGLTVKASGTGKVVRQHPRAGTKVNIGDYCELASND